MYLIDSSSSSSSSSSISSSSRRSTADLEAVLLGGEDKRCDFFGELIVIVEPAALLEAASLLRHLEADLVVFGMFDDRLGDLLIADVDCCQQRLIHLPPVNVVQQEPHRLRYHIAVSARDVNEASKVLGRGQGRGQIPQGRGLRSLNMTPNFGGFTSCDLDF